MSSMRWLPAVLTLLCPAAYASFDSASSLAGSTLLTTSQDRQDTDQRAQRILDRIEKEIRDSNARLREEIRALIRAEIEKTRGKTPAPPAAKRPYLGISVEDLTEADRASQGVNAGLKIVDVRGPADKAGLKAGDILVEVDGQAVTEDRLAEAISKRKPGDTLDVSIVRQKQKQTVKVVLGERKE